MCSSACLRSSSVCGCLLVPQWSWGRTLFPACSQMDAMRSRCPISTTCSDLDPDPAHSPRLPNRPLTAFRHIRFRRDLTETSLAVPAGSPTMLIKTEALHPGLAIRSISVRFTEISWSGSMPDAIATISALSMWKDATESPRNRTAAGVRGDRLDRVNRGRLGPKGPAWLGGESQRGSANRPTHPAWRPTGTGVVG
jgi:hypothetical protein